MVNVQQVDKHHDLFKISLAGGFLDPDYDQNTHTLDPSCTYLVPKHKYALIMNLYTCKDGTLLYFLLNDKFRPNKSIRRSLYYHKTFSC